MHTSSEYEDYYCTVQEQHGAEWVMGAGKIPTYERDKHILDLGANRRNGGVALLFLCSLRDAPETCR